MIFKKIFSKMFNKAMLLNRDNILKFLDHNKNSKLLDLGCDDGVWTLKLANAIGAKDIYGVEIVKQKADISAEKGIIVANSNLNDQLPYQDLMFDVVHANQVIEHVANLDLFVSEIYRILKTDGYTVISTENASSWHNIFASILGWQIFSLTNISTKCAGIGNPLAIHRNETDFVTQSWTHKTIFNYLGLIEMFKEHNFKKIEIKGAGYYPFPAFCGKIDVRHSHFITIKATK